MTLSNTNLGDIPNITTTLEGFINAVPHVAGCLEGFYKYHPNNWKYAFQFKNEEANDLVRTIDRVKNYLNKNHRSVRLYSNDGREYFKVHGAGEVRFIIYLVTGDI